MQHFTKYQWIGEGSMLISGGMTGTKYDFYATGVILHIDDRDTNVSKIPSIIKVE